MVLINLFCLPQRNWLFYIRVMYRVTTVRCGHRPLWVECEYVTVGLIHESTGIEHSDSAFKGFPLGAWLKKTTKSFLVWCKKPFKVFCTLLKPQGGFKAPPIGGGEGYMCTTIRRKRRTLQFVCILSSLHRRKRRFPTCRFGWALVWLVHRRGGCPHPPTRFCTLFFSSP